jgi:hypothetical protein
MSKKKPTAPTRRRTLRKKLSYQEFVAQYGSAINEGRAADERAIVEQEAAEERRRLDPLGSLNSALGLRNMLKNPYALAASGPPSGSLKPEQKRIRPVPWDAIKGSWIIEQLQSAARDNNLEAFLWLSRLLFLWLDVKPPEGAFDPASKGGRPPDTLSGSTISTLEAWHSLGDPKPTVKNLERLARMIHPTEFAKSRKGTKRYKNLLDKVGGTIRRHAKPGATKSDFVEATKSIS